MIGRAEDVNTKIPFKSPFILNFEGKVLKINRDFIKYLPILPTAGRGQVQAGRER